MSRQIPMDQPLSDEDREYLLARDRRDLIAQIDEMNAPAEEVDEGEQNSEQNSETEDNYDEWKKADLVEEATKRDLDASGTKADIIARLREDDAEDEGGAE